MSTGKLTWGLELVSVLGRETTEVCVSSEFQVRPPNPLYSVGNAHLFCLPAGAERVVVEEVIRRSSDDDEILVAAYGLSDPALHHLVHEQCLCVYPLTKSFDHIASLRLSLRYVMDSNIPVSRTEFDVSVSQAFYNARYLVNLGADSDEALNRLRIHIVVPPGYVCEGG